MSRRFLAAFLLAAGALSIAADPFEDARKVFLPKYKSPDAKVRVEAVRALKDYNTKDGMDFMVPLYLLEPDPTVQQAWVDMIGGPVEGEGRKRLYEYCRTGKVETRVKIIRILGRGGYRDLMDLLKDLTHDGEPLVRRAAHESIASGKFGSMEAVVRAGLTDMEPDVRAAAAKAVGSFRREESVPALIRLLEDPKEEADVKTAVADALAEITGQKFGPEADTWKTWLEGRKGLRVTQADVDRALDRASQWMLKLHPDGYAGTEETLELELYALIHCGIPLDHKNMKSAITGLYKKPMARAYNVSLGAMALADVSPTLHQSWLAKAAEFLANCQCDNGQFWYGEATPGDTPTLAPPEITPGARPEFGGGTKALKRITVRKNPKRKIAKVGDNSNTQYAVLGLRACAEAGIDIQKEVWVECMAYLKSNNTNAGSFTYSPTSGGDYGSIHTSALGAYIVCRWYAGSGNRRDVVIDRGLEWLSQNFAIDQNPKHNDPKAWVYYYLYGMERVGVLADTEFFGKREWYQEGAKFLLSAQTAGGDWNNDARDTAWAILFLRRATRPVGKIEDK
ncbi:MAG: hypothetical protein FD180_3265 [Planctomycetota bacterium]|nr:MAG: hypothetical protein FD180_3265 [Planctomycetota bacterium]